MCDTGLYDRYRKARSAIRSLFSYTGVSPQTLYDSLRQLNEELLCYIDEIEMRIEADEDVDLTP